VEPEEIPRGPAAEYLIEPSLEGDESPLVIFCIDISGSMCVTTEVDAGKVGFCCDIHGGV
jgi:Mg-chelatase subunit ChlD